MSISDIYQSIKEILELQARFEEGMKQLQSDISENGKDISDALERVRENRERIIKLESVDMEAKIVKVAAEYYSGSRGKGRHGEGAPRLPNYDDDK